MEVGRAENVRLCEFIRFSRDVQAVGKIGEWGKRSIGTNHIFGFLGIALLHDYAADQRFNAVDGNAVACSVHRDLFDRASLLEQVDPLCGCVGGSGFGNAECSEERVS